MSAPCLCHSIVTILRTTVLRPACLQSSIPVVDLSQNDEAATAKKVYEACTTSGFFYVSNHNVPQHLVDSMFEQNTALFALSMHKKMEMLADGNNRGYTPFAEETLDPAAQSVGDSKEGFYFGREIPVDSPEASKPLHGPNQWPDEQLLPSYRAVTTAYFRAMQQLGTRLLRLLALSLGLPAEHFHAMFDPPMMFLRPLHYSAQVSNPDAGVFGAGAHTDYGMLTILATDHVPGLQLRDRGSHEWMDVPPAPGLFIINLGDMLERWTNGTFHSTLHRVINTTGQERYSIPFFFEPNFDAVVECLPQCCSDKCPAQYPPITAGQYLLDKYAVTHANYKGTKHAT
eukprot:jgi/Chrzof1/14250/Cz08g31020.t1